MTRPSRLSAVVTIPLLDLRRLPDHASEMLSQLVLGEVLDVLEAAQSRRWLRVRNRLDGYCGWVRAWGIIQVSRSRAARWLARARHRVGALHTEVLTEPVGGTSVTPLFWNSHVIAGKRRGKLSRIELPDGRGGWTPTSALSRQPARPPALIDRIRTLIGAPYLWGGRSPAGLDCSGFTQMVLAEQGVRLPRDARDQLRVCRPLGPCQRGRSGDLVFFGPPARRGAHVGLYLGLGYFAHARGRVMISSLDPDNMLCDNDLIAQYRGLARPPADWKPRGWKIALTRIPQLP